MKRRDFIKVVTAGTSAAVIGCGDKEGVSKGPILSRTALSKFEGITSIHEHVDSVEAGEKLIQAMDLTGVARMNLLGAYTTLLHGKKLDWESKEENNEVLFKLIKKYPDRFTMFALMDGSERDIAGTLGAYLEKGAIGLKMYNGVAGKYRRMPLTDKRLRPLFELCELNGIPVLIHVDRKRLDEYLNIVRDYPSIPWICPHLFVMTKPSQLGRMEQIFRRYPNLYTDQSFGFEGWMHSNLSSLSESRDRVRRIFIENGKRILFGTDIVFALSSKHRTVKWAANSIGEYRKFLEFDNFKHSVKSRKKHFEGDLNGLALPDDVLRQIYVENPKRLLEGPQIKFHRDSLKNVSTTLPERYELMEQGPYELLAVAAVANLSEISSFDVGKVGGPDKIGCFSPLLSPVAKKLELDEVSLTPFDDVGSLIETTAHDEKMVAIVPFGAMEPRLRALPINKYDPFGRDGIERCASNRNGSKSTFFGDYPLLLSYSSPDTGPVDESIYDPFELRSVLLTGTTLFGNGMLDTSIMDPLESVKKIAGYCQSADVMHLAVEDVVRSTCKQNLKKWRFCYDPDWLHVIDYLGVDVLDLTGNHLGDFGQESLQETIGKYASAGIPVFGGGIDLEHALEPAVVTVRGLRIGFAGTNRLNQGRSVAAKNKAGPLGGLDNFRETIERARKRTDAFFVTYQGGYEFSPRPWNDLLRHSKWAIQAGATAVAGIHSHMPMGAEVRDGSFVAYGLGNFYFRHPASTIPNRPMSERGTILRSVLYKNKLVQANLLPIRLKKGELALADSTDRKMVRSRVKNASRNGLAPTEAFESLSDAMLEINEPKQISKLSRVQVKLGANHILVGLTARAAKKAGSAAKIVKALNETKQIHKRRMDLSINTAFTLVAGQQLPQNGFDAVRIYVDQFSSELQGRIKAALKIPKPLQIVLSGGAPFDRVIRALAGCRGPVILSGIPRFIKKIEELGQALRTNQKLYVDTSAGNDRQMRDWFASLSSRKDDWREFWNLNSDRILMATGITSEVKRHSWSQHARLLRALVDVVTEETVRVPIWKKGNKSEWKGYVYEDEVEADGLAFGIDTSNAFVCNNFTKIFK